MAIRRLRVDLLKGGTVQFKDENGDEQKAKKKHIKRDDVVTWSTDDGTLDLDFKPLSGQGHKKHPFTEEPTHLEPHSIKLFHVDPFADADTYEYNLTLNVNGKEYPVDPKIILDPGVGFLPELLRIVCVSAAVVSVGWFLFEIFSRDRNRDF